MLILKKITSSWILKSKKFLFFFHIFEKQNGHFNLAWIFKSELERQIFKKIENYENYVISRVIDHFSASSINHILE